VRFLRSIVPMLLTASLLAMCGARALAQMPEIPHERPAPEPGHPETGKESAGSDAEAGRIIRENGHINRSAEDLRRLTSPVKAPPNPVEVLWKATPNPAGGRDYKAYVAGKDGGAPHFLSQSDLQALYNSSTPVVNSGDVPHGSRWQQLTANHGEKVVIHEERSANAKWNDIAGAVELAGKPLNPANTRVFNALPQESSAAASQRERHRMQIVGTGEAWKAVNERIRHETDGFHTEVADKKALLDELHYGHSSVIVVYAHFDGQRLYLPGAEGGTLSVDEIAKIDRVGDPAVRDRVIILAACSTAAPTDSGSLASLLLQKGIARTVLATDHPYDARDIPDLMARLRSGKPVRESGGQLRQYVELGEQRLFMNRFLSQAMERETSSGE
jgi:hypothetical protein